MNGDPMHLLHPQAGALGATAVAVTIAMKTPTTLLEIISEALLLLTIVATTAAILGHMATTVGIDITTGVSHGTTAAVVEGAMAHPTIGAVTVTPGVSPLMKGKSTTVVGISTTEDVQDLAQVQDRTIGKKVAIKSTQLTHTEEGHHLQNGSGIIKVESAVVGIIAGESEKEEITTLLVLLHAVGDLLQSFTMRTDLMHIHIEVAVAVEGTVAAAAVTMKVGRSKEVKVRVLLMVHPHLVEKQGEMEKKESYLWEITSGTNHSILSSSSNGTILEMEIVGEIGEIDRLSIAEVVEGINIMVLLLEEGMEGLIEDLKEVVVPHRLPGDNCRRPPTVAVCHV